MSACIFCQSKGPFSSVSHIVPESLGGQLSPVAQPGITCDACNQYFGQKVEPKALGSFPFSTYRLFQGMPTKKRKMTSMQVTIGQIHASGIPGILHLEPRDQGIYEKVASKEVRVFRIPAVVTEPLAICRMLLKIGLEVLANEFYDVATSPRLQDAINYARNPRRGQRWWFVLHTDPEEMASYKDSQEEGIHFVEVIENNEVFCLVLRLTGITIFTPLEPCNPDPADVATSPFSVIWSKC
jgi:hypothetical protein